VAERPFGMSELRNNIAWMHDLACKRMQDQTDQAIEMVYEDCYGCIDEKLDHFGVPDIKFRPHTCKDELARIHTSYKEQLAKLDAIKLELEKLLP
jgi:hypothetical protein